MTFVFNVCSGNCNICDDIFHSVYFVRPSVEHPDQVQVSVIIRRIIFIPYPSLELLLCKPQPHPHEGVSVSPHSAHYLPFPNCKWELMRPFLQTNIPPKRIRQNGNHHLVERTRESATYADDAVRSTRKHMYSKNAVEAHFELNIGVESSFVRKIIGLRLHHGTAPRSWESGKHE